MAYTELIKNFEKVRSYMRDFYVYGFKSRGEFDKKSSRSYDNERRRIESYLGDYMAFRQTSEGKNVFLSIDSRSTRSNPLNNAFKAKSFTDRDITLHFILSDILNDSYTALTLNEIMEKMDGEYLSWFKNPMMFDVSTVRKKIKEYTELGIFQSFKQGKQMVYRRSDDVDLSLWGDAVAFFSEVGMEGIIGSYLMDMRNIENKYFLFKHNYITHVLESEVLYYIFEAMREKKTVIIKNFTDKSGTVKTREVVPIKIFVSAQNGRRYLMGYSIGLYQVQSYRLDFITDVKIGKDALRFDELREKLKNMQEHMWGVSCCKKKTVFEYVEFTIYIEKYEEHIIRRLLREKRCGVVEQLDENVWKFSAEVYDSSELIPWIRTFICRIRSMDFSNRTVENIFKKDIEDMYGIYGIGDDE